MLVSATACHTPSAREQIVDTLERAIAAAEEGDLRGLFEHVSDAYADDRGRDKAALRGMVALQFRGRGRIHLFTRIGEPAFPDATEAEVAVTVAAASTPVTLDQLASIDADLFRVDLTLALEGGAWRVVRARRGPAELADFF